MKDQIVNKYHCEYCGKQLATGKATNRYSNGTYYGDCLGEDYDQKTGERLFLVEVNCNCKWLGNYNRIIATDVKRSELINYGISSI